MFYGNSVLFTQIMVASQIFHIMADNPKTVKTGKPPAIGSNR